MNTEATHTLNQESEGLYVIIYVAVIFFAFLFIFIAVLATERCRRVCERLVAGTSWTSQSMKNDHTSRISALDRQRSLTFYNKVPVQNISHESIDNGSTVVHETRRNEGRIYKNELTNTHIVVENRTAVASLRGTPRPSHDMDSTEVPPTAADKVKAEIHQSLGSGGRAIQAVAQDSWLKNPKLNQCSVGSLSGLGRSGVEYPRCATSSTRPEDKGHVSGERVCPNSSLDWNVTPIVHKGT